MITYDFNEKFCFHISRFSSEYIVCNNIDLNKGLTRSETIIAKDVFDKNHTMVENHWHANAMYPSHWHAYAYRHIRTNIISSTIP